MLRSYAIFKTGRLILPVQCHSFRWSHGHASGMIGYFRTVATSLERTMAIIKNMIGPKSPEQPEFSKAVTTIKEKIIRKFPEQKELSISNMSRLLPRLTLPSTPSQKPVDVNVPKLQMSTGAKSIHRHRLRPVYWQSLRVNGRKDAEDEQNQDTASTHSTLSKPKKPFSIYK